MPKNTLKPWTEMVELTYMKLKVTKFCLQPTPSFPDGAPQREECESDDIHRQDCRRYITEWIQKYECLGLTTHWLTDGRDGRTITECRDRNCPQHFPNE